MWNFPPESDGHYKPLMWLKTLAAAANTLVLAREFTHVFAQLLWFITKKLRKMYGFKPGSHQLCMRECVLCVRENENFVSWPIILFSLPWVWREKFAKSTARLAYANAALMYVHSVCEYTYTWELTFWCVSLCWCNANMRPCAGKSGWMVFN